MIQSGPKDLSLIFLGVNGLEIPQNFSVWRDMLIFCKNTLSSCCQLWVYPVIRVFFIFSTSVLTSNDLVHVVWPWFEKDDNISIS